MVNFRNVDGGNVRWSGEVLSRNMLDAYELWVIEGGAHVELTNSAL